MNHATSRETSRKMKLVGILSSHYQPRRQKIMNTSIASPSTPDLELLRKAVQEFQPAPSRIPFHTLKPYHEFIVMLRAKRASYRSVAELLEKQGVKTSLERVAEYGRIVLDGGKGRKRRKRARTAQAVNTPATPQSAPAVVTTVLPTAAPANSVPPSPSENSQYKSRGPRIANVRMMSPEEAKEFNASLKPENAPKP
jgi:hypothetical protein